MKYNSLVSIIIPTYNEERYISNCLNSVFSQSYSPIEVIVVDDGSTDRTIEKVKKFQVEIIKQKHKGPSIARNRGAREANGEIFAFLDADMRYDKKFIELLVGPIVKGKAIGTFNRKEFVANTDNIWSNCWAINSDLPIDKRHKDKLPNRLPLFRAVLKSEFKEVGGYDNSGYSDDVSISAKLGIKALGVSDAISYHYNPETLTEVFYSARWIGRERDLFKPNLYNFLRFNPLNSILISIRKIIKEKSPIAFIIFKIVYDIGMFAGVFLSFKNKSK